MSCGSTSTIDPSTVLTLIEGMPSYNGEGECTTELDQSSDMFEEVSRIVENRIMKLTNNPFTIPRVEMAYSSDMSQRFYEKIRQGRFNNLHFLFHGTNEGNMDGIFASGFIVSSSGDGLANGRYYGSGVYFSPNPEYAAFYIQGAPDHVIRRKPDDPVKLGRTCTVLGCLVNVGRCKTVDRYIGDVPIDPRYDSHHAWADTFAEPAKRPEDRYAEEYIIGDVETILPLFIIHIRRVHAIEVFSSYDFHMEYDGVEMVAQERKAYRKESGGRYEEAVLRQGRIRDKHGGAMEFKQVKMKGKPRKA